MLSDTPGLCRSCGLPSTNDLCPDCEPSAPLLVEDPAARVAALAALGADDRRFVLLVALRARRLWSGPLAEPLLRWLMDHGGTLLFARWLAEDARHGWIAWPSLAVAEPDRTLARAPLWLAPADAPVAHLLKPWRGDLARQSALVIRLSSCGLDDARIDATIAAMPWTVRAFGRLGRHAGRAHPTEVGWRPQPALAERTRRRWPIERLERDGILCCTVCGENLPAAGPCGWCDTDPEDEPPTVLPLADLFSERALCPVCSHDQCSAAVPLQCACCGVERDL